MGKEATKEKDRIRGKQFEEARKRREKFTERDRRLIETAADHAKLLPSGKYLRSVVAETAEDYDRSPEHYEGLPEREFTEEAGLELIRELREKYLYPYQITEDINRFVPSNWHNLDDWLSLLWDCWVDGERLARALEQVGPLGEGATGADLRDHEALVAHAYDLGDWFTDHHKLLKTEMYRLEEIREQNPEALEGELAEVKRRHHKKVITYMEVWRLKHDEGYTFEEVGIRLGTSKDTAKKQFYAAFKELTGYNYSKASYDQYKRDQQTGKGAAKGQTPCSICPEGPKNGGPNLCEKTDCKIIKTFLAKESVTMQFYNFADSLEAEVKLYSTGRVSPHKSADRQKIKFVPEPPEITGRRYEPKPEKKKEETVKALDDLFKPGGKK